MTLALRTLLLSVPCPRSVVEHTQTAPTGKSSGEVWLTTSRTDRLLSDSPGRRARLPSIWYKPAEDSFLFAAPHLVIVFGGSDHDEDATDAPSEACQMSEPSVSRR